VDKYHEAATEPVKPAAEASADIGWREGISPAVRLQYWAYLGRWKKHGEKGWWWTVADIACAHRNLDQALNEGDEEKAAGYRKFLLMDDEIAVTTENCEDFSFG